MTAIDLTHTQLLLILAICYLPAALQVVFNAFVHWLWLLLPTLAAVLVVVAW